LRSTGANIANFWVDLVRTVVRILVPLSTVVTLILLALGVVNHLHGAQDCHDPYWWTSGHSWRPVARWESIKLMSGDGGGAFSVNSPSFREPDTAHRRRRNRCDAFDSGRIHQNPWGDGRRQETGLGAICSSRNPIRDWHRGNHRV